MCNCEEETKRRILEKYPNMTSIENNNEFLSLDTFRAVIANSYTVSRKYNTKSGKERTEKRVINRAHVYCPFCGECLEKVED